MTADDIIGTEQDFMIVDEKTVNMLKSDNLADDLENLGFLEGMTEEQKKAFEDLKNEKKDGEYYDL